MPTKSANLVMDKTGSALGKTAFKTVPLTKPRSLSHTALDRVIVRGNRLTGNLAQAVTGCSLSVSIDQISELSLTLYDPEFGLLRSGIVDRGANVDFQQFQQIVTSVETGAAADRLGMLTVKAQSLHVTLLRQRRGALVKRNMSPSQFVRLECRAIGAKYVIQPSPKRKRVARDTPSSDSGGGSASTPSSWSTFERFARELGFALFEAAGIIYFGKPSWLRTRDLKTPTLVTYKTGRVTDAVGTPRFVESSTADSGIEVSFEVPRGLSNQFHAGQVVKFGFPPYHQETFLITGVTYPIAGGENCQVTASQPRDPTAEGEAKTTSPTSSSLSTGTAATRTSRKLRDVLARAGFKGRALDIAAGIAWAESRLNAHALGDVGIQTAKWGPSVGLFQIRSLKKASSFSGLDRLRVRSKLMDAEYNAEVAYKFSNGGKNWSAWSTYNSGAYRQYVGKHNVNIKNFDGIKVKVKSGGTSTPSTGVTGRKSAHDFVALCLKQKGDRYVWGASPRGANPGSFDCSSLIQWACGRVGVTGMPRVSGDQIAYCARKGKEISLAQAYKTRGALLWHPGHVAISLGNGKTIEAANSRVGVVTYSARGRFKRAALIPGMRY